MNQKSKIENRKSRPGHIIAIDGPAGSGKSTLAKLLAKELAYTYIDTGAMYRAVALKMHELVIDIEDTNVLKDFCSKINLCFENKNGINRISIDGDDYSEKIRTSFVSQLSSKVSSKKAVRDAMVRLQRLLAAKGSVIMEGRDIGTVVFPDADIKFYIDASPEVRGKRRHSELQEKGQDVSLEKIIEDEKKRDLMDSTREHAPLKKADDAVYIDTSDMTIREVVAKMLEIIKQRKIF
ncbi:MAG: (d)CMP kinase [Deltaproteobacteria bacterium]|nr:(d)CMP kinase [Deltaproteobacteria bacterium]